LKIKTIDGMGSEEQSVDDAWNQIRRNVESAAIETVEREREIKETTGMTMNAASPWTTKTQLD